VWTAVGPPAVTPSPKLHVYDEIIVLGWRPNEVAANVAGVPSTGRLGE
jgi:hypothetical protein